MYHIVIKKDKEKRELGAYKTKKEARYQRRQFIKMYGNECTITIIDTSVEKTNG